MDVEFWWGNAFENDNLEDREMDRKTKLRWVLGR